MREAIWSLKVAQQARVGSLRVVSCGFGEVVTEFGRNGEHQALFQGTRGKARYLRHDPHLTASTAKVLYLLASRRSLGLFTKCPWAHHTLSINVLPAISPRVSSHRRRMEYSIFKKRIARNL